MTHEMVAAVAAYRFGNHIETEAAAIRRLIEIGFAAGAGPAQKVGKPR